jgi:hypothetical protein
VSTFWGQAHIKPLPSSVELQEDRTLLQGQELRVALGYQTGEAFRAAVRNHRIPIPLVKLPGRRGWFAQVSDVALWQESLAKEFSKASSVNKDGTS